MTTTQIAALPARVQELLAGASIETSATDLAGLEKAKSHLPPGSDISITWMPKDTMAQRIAAAVAVREAGFEPIPHIAARFFESHADFERPLKDLAARAGVTKLFLIAGDVDKIRGPFANAIELIETGLIQTAGIREVGISAYPEGHPKISDALLDEAFDQKVEAARNQGLELFAISQLCFTAEPIIAMIKRLRAKGYDRPLRIGLAGPASFKTLIRFAAICGVGASAKALMSRGSMIAKLLTETGPDPVIRDLAEDRALDALGPLSLHFFPFGGLERTARWNAAVAQGRFTLSKDAGFQVQTGG